MLFSAQGEDETLEMNAITLTSLVFFLPHRCRVASGRSVRATSPCATTAATAAGPTRAAATAASSEEPPRDNNQTIIYYAF